MALPLYAELKRRRVFRALVGYGIAAFAVLQRKEGDRVRITAQLVNATDGFHLWSETFDRELTGVFAAQDEISHAVVDALRVRLMPGQQVRRRPVSPEVYNEYLLGKQLFHRLTLENYRRAVAAFERALALNPGDAENHRRYAVAILGPSGRLREAVREAQKATDLDPLSAIALASEIATRWSHAGAFQIAETYAWFGDRDVALGWLERAYAQHDSGLPYLNSDALLRSLHGDPRFAALVKKMKLPGG